MALGADSRQLVKNVVRDGIVLIVPGILAGAAAALALTRLMSSLLYGVTPADPGTFGAVSGILVAVGLLASWLPARRAAAVDPIGSLRWE
jgi:putative ABC transport system permease protein